MTKFYCPKCGKEKLPDNLVSDRKYSVRALCLPYFMCGDCRLIYADKALAKKVFTEWRNSSENPRRIPYRQAYGEMMGLLDETIESYCRTASYKRTKFRKVTD